MFRSRRDAGAGTLEYLGVLTVAAGVVTVLIATGTMSKVLPSQADKALCKIGAGNCSAQSTADQGVSPGRRDAERDARGDRRDRGRGDQDQPSPGVSGPSKPADPLGAPVPGTSVPEPEPPAWAPPDKGSGKHGSESAGALDHLTKLAAETAANAVSHSYPDASRNLLHFLGNSGEPINQDVNKILKDVPEFAARADKDRDILGATAVRRARASGITGPTTYPVNTPWTGFGYQAPDYIYDNRNWFLAMGAWEYNETGQVTVYPPEKPGDSWRFIVSTRTNIRDQYNWDKGKGTNIGPFNVPDDRLANLHRKGLAQEYTITGKSDIGRREGQVP